AASSGSHALRAYPNDAGATLATSGRTLRGHAPRNPRVCWRLRSHLKMRGFMRVGTTKALWQVPERLARINRCPNIRDEELLDSIKTHVLKKLAPIRRFWRFTWRVRCERHRRFCRSS